MEKIERLHQELAAAKKAQADIMHKMEKEYKALCKKYLIGSIIKYRDYVIKIDDIKNTMVCHNLNDGQYHGDFYIIGEYIINNSFGKFYDHNPFSISLYADEIIKADKSKKAHDTFDKIVNDLIQKKTESCDKFGKPLRVNDNVYFISDNEIVSGVLEDFSDKANVWTVYYNDMHIYRKAQDLVKKEKHIF